MSKVQEAYQRRLSEGRLQPDPAQDEAVRALEAVEGHLAVREAAGGGLRRLFHSRSQPIRGVYLWGPAGRGKSMLMDIFCEAAPLAAKRRVHFHAFMSEVQARLDVLRHGSDRDEDVVLQAADELADKVHLLCFDELEVTDIADAMILGRLFERLFEHGVVLVATSNEAPDDLYRDGINRQLFEPFIDLIKAHTTVVRVDGGRDYRRDHAQAEPRYWSPITADTEAAFDAAWRRRLSSTAASAADLTIHGRRLHFETTAGTALRATFEELCARDLGPDDYLAVADRFDPVFLGPIPVLRAEHADQLRRFVILIDALYEARATLFILAEAGPDSLLEAHDEASKRAVSRLNEMRSADWPPTEDIAGGRLGHG